MRYQALKAANLKVADFWIVVVSRHPDDGGSQRL
jgi:hypothetical protein